MRLVHGTGLEGAPDELIARHVRRPGLGEGADEVEQHGTTRKRDTAAVYSFSRIQNRLT